MLFRICNVYDCFVQWGQIEAEPDFIQSTPLHFIQKDWQFLQPATGDKEQVGKVGHVSNIFWRIPAQTDFR